MKTLVAIPAYEEEPTIGSVVLKAKEYADEVLVIDDGSEDATRHVAEMANATVITHERNRGKGAAIRTAFEYSRKNNFSVLVLMDGDGQHDAAEIPNVMEPVLAGKTDIVVGTRWGKANGMPLYRRAGKRSLDYATAAVTGLLTDSQCGFRALSRKAFEEIDVRTNGFGAEIEILVQAVERGLRIAEVPVSSRYDLEGSTLHPVEHGFRVVWSLLKMVAERHPLFFFGVPGVIALTAGLLLGIQTIQSYDQIGSSAGGYTLVVSMLLLIGSLGLFAGVILKTRPRAIPGAPRRPA